MSHVFLTQDVPETTHSPSTAQTHAVVAKLAHVATIVVHAVGDVTKFEVQVGNQSLQSPCVNGVVLLAHVLT